MEAFDTWFNHDKLTFPDFEAGVRARNSSLHLANDKETTYTTTNGNRIHFVIWNRGVHEDSTAGMDVTRIEYANGSAHDTLRPVLGAGDAGNDRDPFLRGTILNSPAEAVVEISNPYLRRKIRLDLSKDVFPKRTDENGVVEYGDSEHQPWVDFDWNGPHDGDFYHPYNSLAAAAAAVPDGGVIRIAPGHKTERLSIRGKRVKLIAPIGDVRISAR
jgi:hypothetical protein